MAPDGDKLLGIFGGMGAEAGAMLYQRLVQRTAVDNDQQHIPTVLYSATMVPDRTDSILGTGEPCLPALVDGVRFLERCGADEIIIGCMTAHHFIDQMRAAVSCEIISAIEQTVQVIRTRLPEATSVGILATTGTITTGIFQNALEAAGITSEVLDADKQTRWTMEAIYGKNGIKIGAIQPGRTLLFHAAEELTSRGVDGLISGCTEIPLALHPEDCKVPLFDPLDALIDTAIRACGREPTSAASTSAKMVSAEQIEGR